MPGKISIATYLFRRLKQQGVDAIHGVPGDFTLRAIDQLKQTGIKWVGTCNELNAGYAADGYARIKGLGALLTTYGVGELSAINAVAGSFAENVPVVHIVGGPNVHAVQSKRHLIHHAFPDRPLDIFANIHDNVTIAQCYPFKPDDACNLIDTTIEAAVQYRRPVYIRLPSDAVDRMVSDSSLTTSLQRDIFGMGIQKRTEDIAADLIWKLQRSKFPLLLVDRARDLDTARKELNDFVRHSGIPTITMPSGAGMIDHDIPNYLGVHSGPVGQINTMPLVEQADLILAFGPMFSDTQTLGWKTVPASNKTIQIPHFRFEKIAEKMTPVSPVNTKSLLVLLKERLWRNSLPIHTHTPPLLKEIPDFRTLPPPEPSPPDSPITQSSFYARVNPYFRPHDIIVLGNATPILGGRDFILPSPTNRVICSGLSFSIGHMLPATLGAALAQQHVHPEQSASASSYARDIHQSSRGRVVLFDGDGSFQVSAQELSTIIRLRLNVTIFIMNNAGYAYERLIHGMNADYNDIAEWDYLSLPAAFGGREALKKAAEEGEQYSISCACLRTWADLDAFLADQRFDNGFEGTGRRGLKLVDVRVGRTDVPERFEGVFERAGEALRGGSSGDDGENKETEIEREVEDEESENEDDTPTTWSIKKPHPNPAFAMRRSDGQNTGEKAREEEGNQDDIPIKWRIKSTYERPGSIAPGIDRNRDANVTTEEREKIRESSRQRLEDENRGIEDEEGDTEKTRNQNRLQIRRTNKKPPQISNTTSRPTSTPTPTSTSTSANSDDSEKNEKEEMTDEERATSRELAREKVRKEDRDIEAMTKESFKELEGEIDAKTQKAEAVKVENEEELEEVEDMGRGAKWAWTSRDNKRVEKHEDKEMGSELAEGQYQGEIWRAKIKNKKEKKNGKKQKLRRRGEGEESDGNGD